MHELEVREASRAQKTREKQPVSNARDMSNGTDEEREASRAPETQNKRSVSNARDILNDLDAAKQTLRLVLRFMAVVW